MQSLAMLAIALAALACTFEAPAASSVPPGLSVFDLGGTAYGFFPSPPEASLASILDRFEALGEQADFVLVQPNIPWEDLVSSTGPESQRLTDIRNQVTYAAVGAEAPETRVFVTFQWQDLNNLFPAAGEGPAPYQVNWHQIEAIEPMLDLWAISSYPFVALQSGEEIPGDYCTPLLARTDKPLAVAEGGYTPSRSSGSPGRLGISWTI
jgi:hypothetical protein